MNSRSATLDDIFAVFSSYIEKSYPEPSDFRRNFDVLLHSKRQRAKSSSYLVSLEKNIVFLSLLIDSALALVECLLDPDRPFEGTGLQALVEDLEKKAHDATNERHKKAFVDRSDQEFASLLEGKAAGEASYIERLEFDYRYLMTLRLFIFEFVNVIVAVRAEYKLDRLEPSGIDRIKKQLSLMTNYYLGNLSVGDGGTGEASKN